MTPSPGSKTLFSIMAVAVVALLVSPVFFVTRVQGEGGMPDSAVASDGSVLTLGNASTSYYSHIYLPVMLTHGGPFTDLVQDFYLAPGVLQAAGVLRDVSSQNVTFAIKALSSGEIEIDGNGTFAASFSNTILYYLNLTSTVREQVKTEVVATYSRLGSGSYGEISGQVTLAAGWTNIGPSNILTTNSTTPASGVASAIGYSPGNLSVLYVATGQSHPFSGPKGYPGVVGFGGLLKSVDGGKTWNPVNLGLNSTSITSIAVDPTNPERLVVETQGIANPVGGAIYESVNGGSSWQETYDLGGNSLQYINNTLYATTFGSVLKSPDFGLTWSTVSTFFSHPDNFSLVTASDVVDGGRTIYVGAGYIAPSPPGQFIDNSALQNSYAEIYRSDDYGRTYTSLVNFTASQFSNLTPTISQVIQNPANPSQVWALVSSDFFAAEHGNPSVYESTDSGETWSVFTGVPQTPEPPQYITIDPSNGNVIYIAGPGWLYRSSDSGATFTMLSPGYDHRFLNVDPTNDSVLFLGSDQGLYESTDAGNTWLPLNDRSASLLYGVAEDGPRVFATVQDFGPLYSDDYGKTWTNINKGELGSVQVDPYNTSNVVMWTEPHSTAGGPFFFVSNDGGQSFYLPSINFTAELSYPNNGQLIAFANDSTNTFYVAGGASVFVSNDFGKTWQQAPSSPQNALSIATSPSDPELVLASSYLGLYESTDAGQTWSYTNGTMEGVYAGSTRAAFDAMAIDPANSQIIMASEYLPATPFGIVTHGYVFISRDGGKTFTYDGLSSTDAFQSQPEVYFADAGSFLTAVYTSDQGVFLSMDLGSTWIDASYNINPPVISWFYLSSNSTAYVSTYGSGIWVDKDLFNSTFTAMYPNTPSASSTTTGSAVTTASTTTYTTGTTTTSQTQTSRTTPSTTISSSGGGIPEFPFDIIAVAGVTSFMAMAYFMARRRGNQREP